MGLLPHTPNISSYQMDSSMHAGGPSSSCEIIQVGTYETRVTGFILAEKLNMDDAVPIARETTGNIIRNGEVVFPPYECIRKRICDGKHVGKCVPNCWVPREYSFGCSIERLKRIRNLHGFISDAITKDNDTVSSIDNSDHRINHAKYEASPGVLKQSSSAEFGRLVNIVGYCKNPQCRRRAIHAVAAGDHCRYHCSVCLTTELDKTYADAELSTCAVLFMPSVSKESLIGKPLVQERTPVELRFDDGRAIISQNPARGFWLRIAPRDRERASDIFWRLPWIFVVTDICHYKGSKGREPSVFLGLYRGHVKGRYVCHNIAIGQKCGSLDQEKVNETLAPFPALIVPAHYPTWIETGPSTNYPGSLVVHHECGLCARKTGMASGVPDMTDLLHRMHIEAMRNPEYSKADSEQRRKILAAKIQGTPAQNTKSMDVSEHTPA